jgi:hypothetical protein
VLVGDQGGAEAARAGAAAGRAPAPAVDAAVAATSPAAARAARRPGAPLRARAAGAERGAAALSELYRSDGQADLDQPLRPAEVVAGFLAAASIAVSAVAMVYRPVRLVPVALLVAFIAVGLSERQFSRLAAFAVFFGALGWLIGMTVAVLSEDPLY